jgi:restriction system protein
MTRRKDRARASRLRGIRIAAGLLALLWLAETATTHSHDVDILLVCLVITSCAVYVQIRRLRSRRQLRSVDAMSGIEFERYTAMMLRNAGYWVNSTEASGDYGVDLIARANGQRIAVQCKRQARPVGIAAVQQVVAGAAMHRCTRAAVITNHTFTPAAQRLAHAHGCQLIDRAGLHKIAAAKRGSVGWPLRAYF